ncbi:hypothetical protein HXX76_000085 [Chlamydomonas incerta]|uniref:Uncharacterized protein n=1 Tax=Chlamydomonas incerta TaxID=51695 RepID=A0A835WDL7_CHLIN|nr:hypothetical protein HXX76_000085 [Chlamydomonas incerta]|eukprot:KAG2445467.1 hypothetical protein HXX76_000085 [Chlamydomonas incerta]
MTNLTGTAIATADKKSSYIVADRILARKAYPWCMTSTTTSYFLQPTVNKTMATKGYLEYSFEMDENYDFCKQLLTKKKRAADIAKMCSTPFYSFMIAVSDECHEAIMSVLTVQMFAVEDVPGKNATEMYCHAHKGHDTGVPLLKYLIKPSYLKPASTAAGAKRHFKLTMRINKRADNKCQDLKTLCGGDTCMVALSDEEYNTCPAFYSKLKGM